MKNNDRKLELSVKLIQMGEALMKEGNDSNDYAIAQTGTFLNLMGSLLFDDNDVQLFAQLCSMFSAKKILDNMEQIKSDMTEFLKAKSEGESYDDFIKRINKLRENDGLGPIG